MYLFYFLIRLTQYLSSIRISIDSPFFAFDQILKEKDTMINKQRTDLTNLRKKNFDFRSKITELEDKAKNDVSAGARQGSRNPRPSHQQR